jgi:3-phosphoshikimate 1-carboxyvinyltransferase
VQIESTLWDANTGDVPKITTRLTLPRGGFTLPGLQVFLPGDPSAAAFLVVAALITPGSWIRLEGVLLNPTRTGLLDALLSMGAKIDWQITGQTHGEPTGWIQAATSDLKATQVKGPLVVRMIDEFPVFAVAAACAEGKTVVREAEELRTKESDRIAALAGELRKIGVMVHETEDGFEIDGGWGVDGGLVQSHGDHRLAMSLAVAGLRAKSALTVADAQVIGESFPSFTAILRQLGADFEVG